MSQRDPPFGPGTKGGSHGNTPPSDLELMLWVDGELGPERAEEVEALVKCDSRARAVVLALKQGSQAISTEALRAAELHGSDTIADNVMDAIEAAASRQFMAPVRRGPAWRGPAITAIGLAVLAAAAWMIILRTATRAPVAQGSSGPASPETSSVADPASAAAATVSIDVVDFGARPGTIFYVPAEDESILPVVWLTEDDTPPDDGDGQ